jgi:peptide/nickel transport system substrate-binding protein
VIANQLNRSGLNVQLQSYEWATFYDDVKKGNFQLATMKWVGTVDPDIYRMAFHSKEVPPGRNRGSYQNPKLDKLMDEGTTAGREKRKKIYDEVQKIVLEDLAIIPLWYDQQVAVASKSVAGYQPEPSSDFQPFLNVSKVKR